jgi:cyanophycin synthetase
MLGDFVERLAESHEAVTDLAKPSRIGMIATAGDRRDEDMHELGAVAAEHFDVLVVREDSALRGRSRGDVAELVAEGARARMASGGARCKQVEIVLEEIPAVHHVMARVNPGDLAVLCVDKHGEVLAELEALSKTAQAGAHVSDG